MKWLIIFALIVFIVYGTMRLMQSAANEDVLRERLFQKYLDEKNNKNHIGVLSDLEKEAVDNVVSNLTNEKPIINDNI